MSATIADDELVDRYMHAVLCRVPKSRRSEVSDELRGRIEADAADRDLRAVLLEIGPPEDLARVYRGAPRQLIGPRLYDTYLRVLWPALGVVAVVLGGLRLLAAVAEASAKDAAPLTIVEVLGQTLGAALTAAVYTAFWVTVVFAVLERVPVEADVHPWKPDELPPVPARHDLAVGEALADLVFAVVLLIGAAGLSPALGLPFFRDAPKALDPSFTDRLVPAMIAVAALWVGVAVVALLVRRWNAPVTAASVVSDLFAVILAAAVLVHRPYFSAEFLDHVADSAGTPLERELDLAVGVVCIVVILTCATGIVTAVRKYLAHRRG